MSSLHLAPSHLLNRPARSYAVAADGCARHKKHAAHSFGPQFFFGLGLHDHCPVGAYALQLTGLAADGHTHNVVMARQEGDSWAPQDSRLRPGSVIRFTNGSGIPDWDHQQITQLTGTLVAIGMSVMRSEWPASSSVPFRGQITVMIDSP